MHSATSTSRQLYLTTMPPMETDCRYQTAVLWERSGYDRYGEPTVGAATDLNVRWEDKKEDLIDSQGNTIAIDAVVVVDRDIAVGSAIWRGTVATLPAGTAVPEDVLYVAKFTSIPDIKGRNFRRRVFLTRDSDALPTSS